MQDQLDKYQGSIDNMSHADLQQMVYAGAQRYTASSFRDNVHRWVQCLRIISTPQDETIHVYKHRKQKGQKVLFEEERIGTSGNDCYPDFS